MKIGTQKYLFKTHTMRFFVQNVFEKSDNTCSFLDKIQEYHDETGLPISFSIRLKFAQHSPDESNHWLTTMEERLLPQHLELILEYLPMTTLQKARNNYIRSCYDKYKLQVSFVQHSLDQIQNYDPFFITMDDIHQSDMLLTGLISKKLFYEEKIIDLKRKKNEL
jgi:hypothetical protein